MFLTVEYHDEHCCLNAIEIDSGLCDTQGGDSFCTKYVCLEHKRVFNNYFGCRFNGIEEVTSELDEDELKHLLEEAKRVKEERGW